MRNRLVIIASLSGLALGCHQESEPPPGLEYRVYDSVLEWGFGPNGKVWNTDSVVVIDIALFGDLGTAIDSTGLLPIEPPDAGGWVTFAREALPTAPRELGEQFALANASPIQLTDDFETTLTVLLIPLDTLIQLFIRDRQTFDPDTMQDPYVMDPWARFHRMYPGAKGFVTFSRVGFDAAEAHALVEMDHTCGPTCGQAYLVFLEKEPEMWAVKQVFYGAVS